MYMNMVIFLIQKYFKRQKESSEIKLAFIKKSQVIFKKWLVEAKMHVDVSPQRPASVKEFPPPLCLERWARLKNCFMQNSVWFLQKPHIYLTNSHQHSVSPYANIYQESNWSYWGRNYSKRVRVFVYTLLFFFQNTSSEGKKAVSQAIQNMMNNFCFFTDIRALGEKWFPYCKLKLLRQIP